MMLSLMFTTERWVGLVMAARALGSSGVGTEGPPGSSIATNSPPDDGKKAGAGGGLTKELIGSNALGPSAMRLVELLAGDMVIAGRMCDVSPKGGEEPGPSFTTLVGVCTS